MLAVVDVAPCSCRAPLSVAELARGAKGIQIWCQRSTSRTNWRVANAVGRIADLTARIERPERDVYDAADAIELLAVFET